MRPADVRCPFDRFQLKLVELSRAIRTWNSEFKYRAVWKGRRHTPVMVFGAVYWGELHILAGNFPRDIPLVTFLKGFSLMDAYITTLHWSIPNNFSRISLNSSNDRHISMPFGPLILLLLLFLWCFNDECRSHPGELHQITVYCLNRSMPVNYDRNASADPIWVEKTNPFIDVDPFPGKSMHANTRRLLKVLDNWPGRQTFGHFSFLPIFFVVGAGLEFVMIKWTVGQTNFCKWHLQCDHADHISTFHSFQMIHSNVVKPWKLLMRNCENWNCKKRSKRPAEKWASFNTLPSMWVPCLWCISGHNAFTTTTSHWAISMNMSKEKCKDGQRQMVHPKMERTSDGERLRLGKSFSLFKNAIIQM